MFGERLKIRLHLFASQSKNTIKWLHFYIVELWVGWMTGEESIGPGLRRQVNNSLAFLFVLGREIEITWPGVKESSSGGVARNWQLTLFSPCIFISTSGHLLFIRQNAKEIHSSFWSGRLSIFLFLRNRDWHMFVLEWWIYLEIRQCVMWIFVFIILLNYKRNNFSHHTTQQILLKLI